MYDVLEQTNVPQKTVEKFQSLQPNLNTYKHMIKHTIYGPWDLEISWESQKIKIMFHVFPVIPNGLFRRRSLRAYVGGGSSEFFQVPEPIWWGEGVEEVSFKIFPSPRDHMGVPAFMEGGGRLGIFLQVPKPIWGKSLEFFRVPGIWRHMKKLTYSFIFSTYSSIFLAIVLHIPSYFLHIPSYFFIHRHISFIWIPECDVYIKNKNYN